MSPFHFIRRFESLFGMTPHQFRIERRLDRAKLLLAAGNHSVTEVCMEVAAREKAEEALAYQTRFVLNEQQWKKFMEALDRPVKVKPRLRKLFNESHVAERRS